MDAPLLHYGVPGRIRLDKMAESKIIRIAPDPEISVHNVEGGEKYAIVDNFLAEPQELISSVYEYSGQFVSERMGHPSRGRDLDPAAIDDFRRFIRSKLSRIFPFHRAGIGLKAFFSNVSLKPEELSVFHRMCHIDPRMRPGTRTFAGVIYLFRNPDLGGTAFYRWKAKDIAEEAYRLAAKDSDAALEYLRERSEVYRRPPEYMTRSNEIAELLEVVPARFNRLVFYNGEIPHSGQITHPELLDSDPTRGRLTLNLFASVRPRG